MSATTHEPSPEQHAAGPATPKPMLVTQYPTAPDVLVLTAPHNVPVSFRQLLAQNGLTPEVIAGLAGQTDAAPDAAKAEAKQKE